ncbi:MAG: ABC transporter permease subunit [Planctomycetes bacterium]|nr:ABC transporter permease subunit [Planctomycetota bacterium]
MRNTVAIMQRELLSLFCSPIGYITIAGFLLVTGVLVLATESFAPGKPANLRGVFYWTPFVLTIIIPAISMRTISEEYRNGTIETLMTAPITDLELVVGKYLAALVFYIIMLAATLVYVVLLVVFGNPDWGAALSAYVGLLLIGVMFTAFGLLASSLTRNQIVAWMLAAVPLMLFAWFAFYIVRQVEGWLRVVFQQINVVGRFEQFNRGWITSDSVVFFLGTALLFLFLTVKVVESRRWR